MTINELIKNPNHFFESEYVINHYNGEDVETIYDSRKDNHVPNDIGMKQVSYIGSYVDIGNLPVIIIEYYE